jgi:hypothetical protein
MHDLDAFSRLAARRLHARSRSAAADDGSSSAEVSKGADHDHQDHDHLVVQAQALSFPIHPPGRLRASADIPWDFRFIGSRSSSPSRRRIWSVVITVDMAILAPI